MIADFFDGSIITVSEGTTRTEELIYALSETLDDIYGDRRFNDEVRSEARVAALQDDSDTLNIIYEDLEAEVEELANRHGYTYGTLEGDGAHFVLAPLTQD